jgi:hypothetical protein
MRTGNNQYPVSQTGKWLLLSMTTISVLFMVFLVIFSGDIIESANSGFAERRIPWFFLIASQAWGQLVLSGLSIFFIIFMVLFYRNYADSIEVDQEGVRYIKKGNTKNGLEWALLKEASIKGKQLTLIGENQAITIPLQSIPKEAKAKITNALNKRGVNDLLPP